MFAFSVIYKTYKKYFLFLCSFQPLPAADLEEWPGGPGFPLIFRPKWGRKGRKKFFGDRPPPSVRVWMTAPLPAPPPLSEGLDPPLPAVPLLNAIYLLQIQRLLAHHDHPVKSNVSQLFKNLQIHLSRIADQMAHLTLFSAKVWCVTV